MGAILAFQKTEPDQAELERRRRRLYALRVRVHRHALDLAGDYQASVFMAMMRDLELGRLAEAAIERWQPLAGSVRKEA